MPSPFPGMDPYLEDRGDWVTFHNRLIGAIDELLSASLGPRFFVAQQTAPLPAGQAITPPTVVLARYPERVEQRFLEIRDGQERRLIAVIEVLSPTNKDGSGARQFDHKRREVMTTSVHWIEIDLLRSGIRFPLAAGKSDYCVILKGDDQPVRDEETSFLIWHVDVRDRLPVIAVPLTADMPAATLDLQAVLNLVYDRYYRGRMGYSGPPSPPLSPADATWANGLIRANGSRN